MNGNYEIIDFEEIVKTYKTIKKVKKVATGEIFEVGEEIQSRDGIKNKIVAMFESDNLQLYPSGIQVNMEYAVTDLNKVFKAK